MLTNLALRALSATSARRASRACATTVSMAAPSLRLVYFNIRARAEPARLALFIGGIPFEDVRIAKEDWPGLKASQPFAQVPVLEVEGVPLAQSYAILLYCGRLAKLVPSEALAAAQVEALLFHFIDLDVLLAPSGKEGDKERKKALRVALAADGGPLRGWFAAIERVLAANASGWLVGGELTVADLALYGRVGSFLKGAYDDIPADIVDAFPRVNALHGRVLAHPKVVEWYAIEGK